MPCSSFSSSDGLSTSLQLQDFSPLDVNTTSEVIRCALCSVSDNAVVSARLVGWACVSIKVLGLAGHFLFWYFLFDSLKGSDSPYTSDTLLLFSHETRFYSSLFGTAFVLRRLEKTYKVVEAVQLPPEHNARLESLKEELCLLHPNDS
ncbi:hypothetical protein Bca4012_091695 [Brassica carinata]|uniref:Uncharacterized protein n=2 Tax=Brassica TaxID=3705 RepID=A0A0D2ZSX1_BRAOL|nr:unnamed protein product [Brassica napus]